MHKNAEPMNVQHKATILIGCAYTTGKQIEKQLLMTY